MSHRTFSLELTPTFQKQMKILKRKDPKAFGRLRTHLVRFIADPFDPELRTHKLRGRLLERYAFSLSESLRVVFRFRDPTTIVLIALGTHSQVYR